MSRFFLGFYLIFFYFFFLIFSHGPPTENPTIPYQRAGASRVRPADRTRLSPGNAAGTGYISLSRVAEFVRIFFLHFSDFPPFFSSNNKRDDEFCSRSFAPRRTSVPRGMTDLSPSTSPPPPPQPPIVVVPEDADETE